MKTNQLARSRVLWISLIIALPLLFLLSLTQGSVPLPMDEIIQVSLEDLGLRSDHKPPIQWNNIYPLREEIRLDRTRSILMGIRLPRAIAALLAGMALSLSGAAMQGLFQNPMASPEVLGVSAGSSLGAVTAISLGLQLRSTAALPVMSFIGGLSTALLIYFLASRRGKTQLLFLLLAGMAMASLINGLISTTLFLSEQYEMSQFIHWTMGGLEGSLWSQLIIPAPVILMGSLLLIAMAPALNLLSMGEEQAHSLGLSVERYKLLILFTSALLTAMAISLAGPIGFVGLLVPHMIRLLIGSEHRRLLPITALAGSAYLLFCDLIARRAFAPVELKTGIITSLIGAPYFIYLILRYQKKGLGR